jgi:hypothetical protein
MGEQLQALLTSGLSSRNKLLDLDSTRDLVGRSSIAS